MDELIRAGRVSLRTLPNGEVVQLVEKQAFARNFDPETRTVEVVASDGSLDRYGDTINPDGFVTNNYDFNPVILIDHDYSVASIVGRSVGLDVVDGQFVQRQQIDKPDKNANAGMVLGLLDNKMLSAVSVGFLPIEWEFREKSKDHDDEEDESFVFGIDFIKQELLEVSWVAVPANPNAVLTDAVPDLVVEPGRIKQEQLDSIYARIMLG